jgi:predicted nucleic acid-binding protein
MNMYDTNFNYPQSVFLDDTALIAFMDANDPRNSKASSLFLDFDDLDRNLTTSNYILFDTHEWLRNHAGYSQAEKFLDIMDKTVELGKLNIVPGNSQLESEARQLLRERPEYHFSLGEACTAVIVLTCSIKRIFTFNPNYSKLRKFNTEIKVIPSEW